MTSDTCASLLKECEEKKQKEKEEKEKRKLLREQKKKEKEEELRKKKAAAEKKKAAAAEKKAAAAEKKAAAAEKKAATAQKKTTVAAKRAAKSVSKSAVTEKSTLTDNDITLIESEENQVTRKRQGSSYALRDKRLRLDAALDSDAPSISTPASTDDTSVKDKTVWQCSICFVEYGEEDDEEWVQCGCGRWTHEVCVDQSDIIIVDANGRELFCLYCSV